MKPNNIETVDLLQKARDGDPVALDELLRLYRPRILKMVNFRIDPRIRSRVDQSDVVQETFMEASKRLPDYLEAPRSPFFLWIRKIAGQKLIDVHRRHLGAQCRNAGQEFSVGQINRPAASSVWLAQHLVDRIGTPSQICVREETTTAIQEAIDSMNPDDREILVMRQFEELSNQEAAQELGIEPAAASKRFVRALQRLQSTVEQLGLTQSLH